MPGAIWIYRPGELRNCVEEAVANPSLTWLPAGFTPTPSASEVADHCVRWLTRCLTVGAQ
jgi:hypothetical protein